jgi:hypothetical protein
MARNHPRVALILPERGIINEPSKNAPPASMTPRCTRITTMKLANALLNCLGFSGRDAADVFEMRLASMTSPSVTGPRLRRTAVPALFAFRRAAH